MSAGTYKSINGYDLALLRQQFIQDKDFRRAADIAEELERRRKARASGVRRVAIDVPVSP